MAVRLLFMERRGLEARLTVIVHAIREADRCREYYGKGKRCAGLDGCDSCLELAAGGGRE